jgi:hypothetical protein
MQDTELFDELLQLRERIGKVKRSLDSGSGNQASIETLELALHALRNGSPNVADEFLERVIETLRNTRESLG